MSSAGDVDGDGIDDFIIGAPEADGGGYGAGESYVVFGRADIGAGASFDVASLDGTNGFIINGIDNFGDAGEAVGAADVNKDGFTDLLIGADEAGGEGSGETYIVLGGPDVGSGGSLDLSSLDGTNGFIFTAEDQDDDLGRVLSGAGDINGDTIDDFLIGADDADGVDNEYSGAGDTYVVFGGASLDDLDVDGVIDLANLDGTNGFVIHGIESYDNSAESVSAAGDVNGDGFADIIIGAEDANPGGQEDAGQAYVVFGGSHLSALDDLDGEDGAIALSNIALGGHGFILGGLNHSDDLGESVSSAGDVNGDGFDDILIGAEAYAGGDTSPAWLMSCLEVPRSAPRAASTSLRSTAPTASASMESMTRIMRAIRSARPATSTAIASMTS